MIKAKLKHSANYVNSHPAFSEAFSILKNLGPDSPDGEIVLGDMKIITNTYATKPAAEKKMETHRKHIDIQYVASGEERIFFGDADGFDIKIPYDADWDAQFYFSDENDRGTQTAILKAGDIAVFFPEDAHKASCSPYGEPVTVKKIVLKVPV